jgi:hypothetical protein
MAWKDSRAERAAEEEKGILWKDRKQVTVNVGMHARIASGSGPLGVQIKRWLQI